MVLSLLYDIDVVVYICSNKVTTLRASQNMTMKSNSNPQRIGLQRIPEDNGNTEIGIKDDPANREQGIYI